MKTIAIHQPNFFPWLGFFDKILRSDCFVILDHVDFPKTGRGTWTNRVQIKINDKAHWLTIPIRRDFGNNTPISKVEIEPNTLWKKKMLATLRHTYAKNGHFKQVYPWIEGIISPDESSLSKFNYHLLLETLKRLKMESRQIRFSSFLGLSSNKTQLLIDITKKCGGDAYLCGGGATNYQNDNLFREQNIKLVYQNFEHPTYPQIGKQFIPGLSILDALFNLGFEGTREILSPWNI